MFSSSWMRGEVNGCTTAVLLGAASGIFSKQLTVSLSSSHPIVSPRRFVKVEGVQQYNSTDTTTPFAVKFTDCLPLQRDKTLMVSFQ